MESFLLLLLVLGLAPSTLAQLEHPDIVPADILEWVNRYRSDTDPDACDMCKIRWNEELAAEATRRALSCGLPSVNDSSVDRDALVETLTDVDREDVVFTAITNWGNSELTDPVYHQLVYSRTCQIGCAAKACPMNYYIFRCHFDMQYIENTTVYTEGAPCNCCTNLGDMYRCLAGPNSTLCTDSEDAYSFGDPHFSVRLASGQLLCFSVRGESGSNFNLISTDYLEMNALFIRSPHHRNNTVLGALGIIVGGRHLVFNSTFNTVMVSNKYNLGPDFVNKITIDGERMLLSMVNEGAKNKAIDVYVKDLQLRFTVLFTNGHLDMLWTSHGIDTRSTHVHGILGQFLQTKVEVDQTNKLLLLPDRPPVAIKQRKVFRFVKHHMLSYKDEPCWAPVKRSQQGVGLIEGVYTDYEVESILSTGFQFAVAKEGSGF